MGADRNQRGSSRRWIVRAVEDSLRRLGTDRIDVYFLHKPDPGTALEESLGAMDDLVHQGKVVNVGISTFPGSWITETQWVAERAGLVRPRVEQPPYSIFSRSIERDVLPAIERFGMGAMVWGPLDNGWLTGKYTAAGAPDASRASRWERTAVQFDPAREQVQRKLALVDALQQVATEAGCSLTHLALAFCAEHPAVSSVIIGPRTPAQLDDLLAAADLRLDGATLDAIDALVPPGLDIDPEYAAGWTPPWIADASLRRR
jgi:aryl-alcohol dehydrogenase (NADP+)